MSAVKQDVTQGGGSNCHASNLYRDDLAALSCIA